MELFQLLLPFIVLFGLMYLMIIRPQQKQQKERNAMLNALEVGDKVITIGGIVGTITRIKDDLVFLRIAPQVEIELKRSGVSGIERAE